MPRPIRIEFAGAIYHVMNRGDRREPIFENDYDKRVFLETLTDCCLKTGWLIHVYCLMKNHFHLVIETPRPNLVRGMQWLLSTYTLRVNTRKDVPGHLFAGRYKAIIVEPEDSTYLRTVCEYVHLNPFRAKAVPENAPLSSFRWSSLPYYLGDPTKRPVWLRVDRVFGGFGINEESQAGRETFGQIMQHRRLNADKKDYNNLKKVWIYSSEKYREELLAKIKEGGEDFKKYGEITRYNEKQTDEILLRREMAKANLKEKDLERLPRFCKQKIQVVIQMRKNSTCTIPWLCERLKMGSPKTLRNILSQLKK